jgi:hypothetical protein
MLSKGNFVHCKYKRELVIYPFSSASAACFRYSIPKIVNMHDPILSSSSSLSSVSFAHNNNLCRETESMHAHR